MRDRTVPAILLLVACWVLFRLLSNGLTGTVAFDGGLNLQVAASVANGEGYTRTYGDPPTFPPDIQTNEPYVLPAALIFWAAGINLFTSQLTNAIYLLVFAGSVLWVVHRVAGASWAALAALACVAVPDLYRYGFNGYGEIVALCWWFGGTSALLTGRGQRPSACTIVVAGALLGTAVATKTVLLIGLAATAGAYVIWRITLGASWRAWSRELCLLALGVAAPLLLVELARLIIIDGWRPYVGWWSAELRAILSQAGVAQGFGDTPGIGNKLSAHLSILAESLGLSQVGAVTLLLAPAVCFVLALRDARRWDGLGLTTALMLGASIYITWWLLITPTEKAWFRRIIDGVLMLELGGILAAAALIAPAFARRGRDASRLFAAAPACLFVGVLGVSMWPQIVEVPRGQQTKETQDLMVAVDWLRGLQPDAHVFGEGWYSAPSLALYAERPLHDLNQWPALRLPVDAPLYLVADAPGLQAHAFASTLTRYAAIPQLADVRYFQGYRVDTTGPKSAFSETSVEASLIRSDVRFLANPDYPYLSGFYGYDRAGAARWIASDAEVLVRATGAQSFYVDVSIPPLSMYKFPGGIRVRVDVGNCPPADASITTPGAQRLTWPVSCPLAAGTSVPVRIRTDNIVVVPRDYRQLALPIHGFGFDSEGSSARSH